MIFNPGCMLESPGKHFFSTNTNVQAPSFRDSDFRTQGGGKGKNWYFVKVPQMIFMYNQSQEPFINLYVFLMIILIHIHIKSNSSLYLKPIFVVFASRMQ